MPLYLSDTRIAVLALACVIIQNSFSTIEITSNVETVLAWQQCETNMKCKNKKVAEGSMNAPSTIKTSVT